MQGGVMRSLACAALWACLLMQAGACAVQSTTRRAATGAIDAFALPGEEEEFRRDVQRLAHRLVRETLEAVPPPSAEQLARDTAQGFFAGFQDRLDDPANRQWLRLVVRTALEEVLLTTRRELQQALPRTGPVLAEAGQGFTQGLADGLASREQVVAGLTDTVGRSLARAIAEQLQLELRGRLDDPALLAGVERVARRASAAVVEGATAELGRTLPACGEGVEGPCIQQLTAQVSRSALAGLMRAVWPLVLLAVLAFGLGMLVAALVRRRPVASQR